MSPKVRVLFALSLAALALLVVALPQTRLTAQDATSVEYGASIVGNVPAEGTQAGYIFPGTVGDLVTIRATGISAGMDPNLTLLGPAQELLVSNDNSLANPSSTASEVVYRLLATGNYTVLVGGTPGDFLLTISVRPAVTVTVLQPDTPAQLSLPAATGVQVFSFNTDPFMATSLLIDADPIDLNALIEVRDATGALVATLQNNLDNACLSLGPGDELAEITVAALPEATGTLTVTLGRGPCQLGPAPEPATVAVPVLQFQPVAIEGVCAASTIYNLNVRSGPGLQYPVLFVNAARQPLQVIGISADGQWYAVQTQGGIQGWIALPIVVIVGPCDTIGVVEAAAPPEASPTPGLPVTTPTVEVTPTLDPAQPTATLEPAQPTATTDPAQPTVVPTVDPAQPTATTDPAQPTVTPEPTVEEPEATEAA
jgi:uncharacterized protein YraI